ncbi:metallo-beta-lactamase class B [Chitinophaga skermanii]|uniref:beta-lactamase n=1 Tax=Chitinophaga skermanii TaxID=331697 RepID=A0A327Q7W0_9BACT|nr:subclass B1 metallo-beta-lactamase [Chitinophaga skermanii]RAJ00391.1 metallo-beta-lactamase class B [Chitinophaga skermanii]
MRIITALCICLLCMNLFQANAQRKASFKPKVVFKSDELIITQITPHTYQHTSYLQTDDFGNVPCNGLIVSNNKEAIIFDTPTNDKGTELLLKWLQDTQHFKVNAIIPTHFHSDCLGGLQAFHSHNIPSYANYKTIALAQERNFTVPQNSFTDSLALPVGKEHIVAKFFGEGHTRDNVVGYFPSEKVLFGGCLIKEIDAGKGFLGDANVAAWPGTVEKVKAAYPQVKVVVPGHGEYGNSKLLDFTIQLFSTK